MPAMAEDLSRFEPVDVDAQFLRESEHPQLPTKWQGQVTFWLKTCFLIPLSLILAPIWLMFWLAKQTMLREAPRPPR